MSLVRHKRVIAAPSFPRVSGDEPADSTPLRSVRMFSPRERG